MQVALAPCIKYLGFVEYAAVQARMREFTLERAADTPDEIWVLEHAPVYTLGQGADEKFGPRLANGIPLVQAERGGEITYHGPGQAVVYALIDIGRANIRVKPFVRLLEQCALEYLAAQGIRGERRPGAPGVYVGGAKIAALGIRVTRGRAWHGLALNVDMDLAPFAAIDPCGYPGLAVTQLKDLGVKTSARAAGEAIAARMQEALEHA